MNDCSFLLLLLCELVHSLVLSDCKSLSYLANILSQDELLRMNGCSFLHLLLCELVHSLALSDCKSLSYLVNILSQDV